MAPLAAMLTQTLIPRGTGNGGRIPASGITDGQDMGPGSIIRKNIAASCTKRSRSRANRDAFTMEKSLAQLVFSQELLREEAMTRAIHAERFGYVAQIEGVLGLVRRSSFIDAKKSHRWVPIGTPNMKRYRLVSVN